MIWCTNDSNAHIPTFCNHLSFISWCFSLWVSKTLSEWESDYDFLQIYRQLLSLATFLRVHSNSIVVSYLSWQNRYPNLKTTCHIKLKFFLWTTILKNLLLAKYFISVAATLIIPLQILFNVNFSIQIFTRSIIILVSRYLQEALSINVIVAFNFFSLTVNFTTFSNIFLWARIHHKISEPFIWEFELYKSFGDAILKRSYWFISYYIT